MPDLIVTLTDAQWASYQAVNGAASLADVTAWLRRQLTAHYVRRLEDADNGTASTTATTARTTRNEKEDAFNA